MNCLCWWKTERSTLDILHYNLYNYCIVNFKMASMIYFIMNERLSGLVDASNIHDVNVVLTGCRYVDMNEI